MKEIEPYLLFFSDFRGMVISPFWVRCWNLMTSVDIKSLACTSSSHTSISIYFSSLNLISSSRSNTTSCPLPVSVLADHSPTFAITYGYDDPNKSPHFNNLTLISVIFNVFAFTFSTYNSTITSPMLLSPR